MLGVWQQATPRINASRLNVRTPDAVYPVLGDGLDLAARLDPQSRD